MKKSILTTVVLFLVLYAASFGYASDKLNIMIIGDSISLGYAPHLSDLMGDRAAVYHNPGNACATWLGVKDGKIEGYLDKTAYGDEIDTWDVVVFNYGLWDIGRASIDKPPRTDIPTYKKHIENIARRIKKSAPGAKVIWANITAIPKGGTKGNKEGDAVPYNEVASEVMKDVGIPECDLHTLTKNFDETCMKPRNVHFTDKGYEEIAKLVQAKIEEELGGEEGGSEDSLAGKELGVKRKTGLYSSQDGTKLIGYLQPGMTVKILEEVSAASVKVSFESGGKSFEGNCRKSDLE